MVVPHVDESLYGQQPPDSVLKVVENGDRRRNRRGNEFFNEEYLTVEGLFWYLSS